MINTLAVHDLELCLLERRRHLVLDHLDPGLVTDNFIAILYRTCAADIQTYGAVELQRVAAGRGLGIAEHDADLHTDLVDEDQHAVSALDAPGQLAQCLGHQSRLQAYVGIAHLAFDFSLGGQRGHGIDDDDINRVGADQHIADFQSLFAGVRLGDQQVINVDAELFGIDRV